MNSLAKELKRAANLLITRPDLQIAEISDMLDFGSPPTFPPLLQGTV